MNQIDLKAAFNLLPELEPVTKWDEHRLALRKHVKDASIDSFLRWSTVQATMFVGDAPYIRNEFDSLIMSWEEDPEAASYYIRTLWERVIMEPSFGRPQVLPYAPYTSGNLVHQAYHLKHWLDVTSLDVDGIVNIVEFGGGYGAMALICHRLGFTGKYTIIDFPEFSLLQKYYLSNVAPDANIEYTCVADLPEMETDLLIACYSLSEADLWTRDWVLGSCIAKEYLLAFQTEWDDIDNVTYFGDLMKSRSFDLRWKISRNHRFKRHWYAVGYVDNE